MSLYRERRLRRRRCYWVVRGGIRKLGCSDSRYSVGCVECIDLRLDEVVLVVVVSSGGGWCWRWC